MLTSTGAVAYTIITMLPIDLILNAGSTGGYPMIFALLLAAIVWNLATWAFGIPNSSSHALIGSILGVGFANQLLAPASEASAGLQWGPVFSVLKSLLFSPLIGFIAAGGLLLLLKLLVHRKDLYQAPEGKKPPPLWIRGLLILTCTGVSFSHGGNDGQKGMGLIMLILIGAAPTAFALNRAMPDSAMPAFIQTTHQAEAILHSHAGSIPSTDAAQARSVVDHALKTRALDQPQVFAALASLSGDIATQIQKHGAISHVPAEAVPNIRNDMYLTSAAVGDLIKTPGVFGGSEAGTMKAYTGHLNQGTRYIPTWVKGVGGDRAGSRHHGRLEADRDHRRREDRQGAPDLRPGRVGRGRRRRHDRHGRGLGSAGLDHAHPVERRRRHDGGERLRPSDEHAAQHGDGLDPDPAGGGPPGRGAVRHPAHRVLTAAASTGRADLPIRR